MKITTKFNVNDRLQIKGQRQSDNAVTWLEVLEIHCQTCSDDTQIFYLTRFHFLVRKLGGRIEQHHGTSKNDGGLGVQKMREDELEHLSPTAQSFIHAHTGDHFQSLKKQDTTAEVSSENDTSA